MNKPAGKLDRCSDDINQLIHGDDANFTMMAAPTDDIDGTNDDDDNGDDVHKVEEFSLEVPWESQCWMPCESELDDAKTYAIQDVISTMSPTTSC